MVKLRELLSADVRDSVIGSRLSAGSVIRVKCDFITPPKIKLLLVLRVSPEVLVYVINSEINQFIRKRPELLKCQVTICAADYDFLRHDSVINCSEVKTENNIGNLRDKMIRDITSTYQGKVKQSAVDEIIAATKFSPKISKEEKGLIISSLKTVTYSP